MFSLIQKNQKCIKKEKLQPLLTARSLAYWFMDDGGKMDYGPNQGKGIVFNTQCFTLDEVQNLCEILKENFELKSWPKKNKGGYVVAVSGTDYEKFLQIVEPFVIPEMKHKFPTPRKS
jgi:LAGLIDADG DNA endonuclease family